MRARTALVGVGSAAALAGLAQVAERLIVARERKRPDPDAGRMLTPAPDLEEIVVAGDGAKLHALRRGQGPPIVLSHGVTLDLRTWVHQLESLPAAGFEAVAFDHRGHGRSSLGSDGYSVEAFGDDLRAVLEQLDLRDVVVVGHSMGGVAALALALTHPELMRERVRGVVLLSSVARVALARRGAITRLTRRLARFVPDSRPVWYAPNLGFLAARLGFGRDAQPSHVELVRQMWIDNTVGSRTEAPLALVGLDLTRELPWLPVPVSVIGGTADVIAPIWNSRELARLIPAATLDVFPGSGHMLMLERAKELDRLLVSFARDLDSGAEDAAVAGTKP